MHDSPGTADSPLSLLDARRRAAVEQALATSTAEGHHVSPRAVQLLVDYARGEITASQYAAGIVDEISEYESVAEPSVTPVGIAPAPTEPAPDEPDEPAEPAEGSDEITRENAVDAFVSGQISVEEFLRIARS
jgi:hypothetical protein